MNEDEIARLQQQINELVNELGSSRDHLRSLQDDLDTLRQEMKIEKGVTRADEPLPAKQTPGFESFIGLRLIHLVGIVVLVIGISIGVKYAIDKQLISEIMRIVLAYSAGLSLLFLSYWLKKNYHLFSAILFSGSMASLYFTTYGAFVYYHFLAAPTAFVLMAGLTIYTVIAAMNYGRQEIAIFGMTGAYGIPFLISANAERVDLFFSYILLINIGIIFLSIRRPWKLLGHLAMFITWILFLGWAIVRYDSAQEITAFIFMSIYYLLFFFNAVADAIKRSRSLTSLEIQQVLTNNTALYFALLAVMGSKEFYSALSTASGFLFLFISAVSILSTIFFPAEILLQRLLAWQAIVLAVLFIGFNWDGVVVTLLWLLLSLILFVWGILKKKSWPRLASILLIGFTLVKLVVFDSQRFSTIQKILSFLVIGILLLLFSFYYQKFDLRSKKAAHKDI